MAYGFYPQIYSQNPQAAYQSMMPRMQNNGFVPVRSENEARNYPVGFGESVTFIDESRKHIYTKTMGMSQFDNPVFDKYRLVKEDASETSPEPQNGALDVEGINSTIDDLKGEIEAIWKELEGVKDSVVKPAASKRRKEIVENDAE